MLPAGILEMTCSTRQHALQATFLCYTVSSHTMAPVQCSIGYSFRHKGFNMNEASQTGVACFHAKTEARPHVHNSRLRVELCHLDALSCSGK